MDDPALQKNEQTSGLIRQVGADVVFSPRYLPDLNPIEMMWNNIKALLRKGAAWTQEDLIATLVRVLEAVTASDNRGWFATAIGLLNTLQLTLGPILNGYSIIKNTQDPPDP